MTETMAQNIFFLLIKMSWDFPPSLIPIALSHREKEHPFDYHADLFFSITIAATPCQHECPPDG